MNDEKLNVLCDKSSDNKKCLNKLNNHNMNLTYWSTSASGTQTGCRNTFVYLSPVWRQKNYNCLSNKNTKLQQTH